MTNLQKAGTDLCSLQVCMTNLGKSGTDLCCCRYVLRQIWKRQELMCVTTGMYDQFAEGGN